MHLNIHFINENCCNVINKFVIDNFHVHKLKIMYVKAMPGFISGFGGQIPILI